MSRSVTVFAALALALALAATAAADEWHRSFSVQSHPVIRIRTDDGHVVVTSWEKPEVGCRVVTTGWSIEKDLELDARQTGNAVELTVRLPSMRWGLFLHPRTVRVEVSLPRNADLEVRTGDGGVEIGPVIGRILAETGDGSIVVEGLKGDIRLHTGDGRIEADGLDGRVKATSGDGHVRIAGRFDALDVETGDGPVVVEAGPGSTLSEGWSVRTSDGSLTMRIPAGLRADLDARTGDGSIHVDLPVAVSGEWSRSRLHGTMNGGGPTLYLRTGDGPIRIERI